MKRLAIFAHFDKKNIIDEYVVYYIKGLLSLGVDVIFVSDGNLLCCESSKISHLVVSIISESHGEYDFGSYKRGYVYAKEHNLLEENDELILCNDSCYAPVYPFIEMFTEMQSRNCDFWGITHSNVGYIYENGVSVDGEVSHLQSYFVVLKRNVFINSHFEYFLQSVKVEKDKMQIILNYELKLTSYLEALGFTYSYYISDEIAFSDTHSIFKKWYELIFKYRAPILKYQSCSLYCADYKKLKKIYPITLIRNNLIHRVGYFKYWYLYCFKSIIIMKMRLLYKKITLRKILNVIKYRFNILFPKRANSYKRYSHLFKDMEGLEIGGISSFFSNYGLFPIYKIVKALDNSNFSNDTIWQGEVKFGKTFFYNKKKPLGFQFISEAISLTQIPSENYDFVCSSNMLEHCANPILALKEQLRVLKPKGVLLLVLPLKEKIFDWQRPVTQIEHLISDYENNIFEDDLTHLPEILSLHDLSLDECAGSYENFKQRSLKNYENRCLHHHIFDKNTLSHIYKYLGLEMVAIEEIGKRFLVGIARKKG